MSDAMRDVVVELDNHICAKTHAYIMQRLAHYNAQQKQLVLRELYDRFVITQYQLKCLEVKLGL